MKSLRGGRFPLALAFAAFLAASGFAADLKVSAVLDPTEITQGQEAFLRVSVAGAGRAKVTVPDVEGLQVSLAGQSTSIQIINFNRMDTVTYTYRVNGFKPGEYTIPAITVEAEGETKQSQPLSLTILKGSDAEAGRAEEPAAPGKEGKIKIESEQKDQPYFLQMDLKEERLYVGQVAPVTIRLFVRMGYDFSPKALPALNSEAFTIGALSPRPEQYQVSVDGVAYHMLVWNSSLTAVKTGDYTLELRQECEVLDRDRILGGGSGLLDQLISRGSVKPVTLKSKPLKMSVLPLPGENRPASFSGAIGSFTFVAQALPLDLAAGEPMEITASIEGSGNFDRIDWPGMAQNRLWRSYPPTSAFKAADAAGIEGKKTCKQAVIPLSAEIKELPMLEFSYFDPVSGQYKILRSDPVPLKIRASVDGMPAVSGPMPAAGLNPDALGLLPNRLSVGRTGQSVRAWISQSWFYGALAVPGLVLLGAFGWAMVPYVKNRLGGGDGARAQDQALAFEIRSMQSALQQSDSDTFAKKARRVLQQVLAREWGCPPESVTRHEVRQRQPQGVRELEGLFAGLDAVDYSGAALSEGEMQKIHAEIQSWLQSRGKGGARV